MRSAQHAQQALQAVTALLGAGLPVPAPARDPDQAAMDALAALESARTARRHISLTIDALMMMLADAGVPWPQLGISGPGDE